MPYTELHVWSRDSDHNVVAVLVGGTIGTLVGSRLSDAIRETALHAIGLVTLLVGVQSFLEYAATGTRIPTLTL